jgi:thiol-disulfide isomerase/thioredoxin
LLAKVYGPNRVKWLWYSPDMRKAILGLSAAALLMFAGCSHGPIREQTDPSLPLTNATPVDLTSAVAQAKAEGKLVLLDFTGSDWCPPCIELHKEIFSKPEFQSYAQSGLIFLVVDFPSKFRLPAAAGATNELLAQKFNIEGFPTLVALNGDGQEIWRHLGGLDGGPRELQDQLQAARKQ